MCGPKHSWPCETPQEERARSRRLRLHSLFQLRSEGSCCWAVVWRGKQAGRGCLRMLPYPVVAQADRCGPSPSQGGPGVLGYIVCPMTPASPPLLFATFPAPAQTVTLLSESLLFPSHYFMSSSLPRDLWNSCVKSRKRNINVTLVWYLFFASEHIVTPRLKLSPVKRTIAGCRLDSALFSSLYTDTQTLLLSRLPLHPLCSLPCVTDRQRIKRPLSALLDSVPCPVFPIIGKTSSG